MSNYTQYKVRKRSPLEITECSGVIEGIYNPKHPIVFTVHPGGRCCIDAKGFPVTINRFEVPADGGKLFLVTAWRCILKVLSGKREIAQVRTGPGVPINYSDIDAEKSITIRIASKEKEE